VTADADDARGGWQVVSAVARIQRGQQLAHCEIAAAAEQDQIEIRDCHDVRLL